MNQIKHQIVLTKTSCSQIEDPPHPFKKRQCVHSLGFVALGALVGACPQPVAAAPVSSTSPHPGLLSLGSPQADVPLSGAGAVLLLQTVRKGKASLGMFEETPQDARGDGQRDHQLIPALLATVQMPSTPREDT